MFEFSVPAMEAGNWQIDNGRTLFQELIGEAERELVARHGLDAVVTHTEVMIYEGMPVGVVEGDTAHHFLVVFEWEPQAEA